MGHLDHTVWPTIPGDCNGWKTDIDEHVTFVVFCPKQKGELMDKLYSWTMRNAAPILFGLAAFLFVVGIGQVLAEFRNAAASTSYGSLDGEPVSQRGLSLLMAFAGFLRAGTSAVWPLAAAAALYRWDRQTKVGEDRNSR